MLRIEELQKRRKTSEEFFTSMMPAVEAAFNGHTKDQLMQPCSANTSGHHLMVPSVVEPMTAVTKHNSVISSASIIQCSRYKSQGPMRSEKVYFLTKIILQKVEELTKEKALLDDRFKMKDEDNDRVKKELTQ